MTTNTRVRNIDYALAGRIGYVRDGDHTLKCEIMYTFDWFPTGRMLNNKPFDCYGKKFAYVKIQRVVLDRVYPDMTGIENIMMDSITLQ